MVLSGRKSRKKISCNSYFFSYDDSTLLTRRAKQETKSVPGIWGIFRKKKHWNQEVKNYIQHNLLPIKPMHHIIHSPEEMKKF